MADLSTKYGHKRSILDRMIRVTSEYMGIKQNELRDPMALLLLECLAEEVYKISGEFDNMEDRILDKLVDMLVSDVKAIARPAHAVLHAIPSESKCLVTPQTSFTLQADNDLTFFPVCNTQLFKGDIKYFAHKGLFYSIDKTQHKTLLSRAKKTSEFADNTFWMGLEVDEKINNLEELSFYIDFTNTYQKINQLSLLPYSIWKMQDREIPITRGIPCKKEKYANHTLELFSGYDLSYKINDSIKKEYDPYFLHIGESFDITEKREFFPDKLKEYYPEGFLEDFTKPLIWIEVACPSEVTDEAISSIRLNINSFPVVCKKLISKTIELNRVVPIIPLDTGNDESFISVCSLIDSMGKEYYDVPFKNSDLYGIYALRRGGCERYDKREARQYLLNILTRITKEASSFMSGEADEKNDMEEIQEDISLLLKGLRSIVLNSKDRYEIKNYILLSPQINDKNLYFVNYWVTVNNIPENMNQGLVMQAEPGLQLDPSSIVLVSSVKKGKGAPGESEKYKIYSKTITNSRILVTNDDIKAYCMQEFGDSISEVQIRKGLIESEDSSIGFIRTTDVYLKPRRGLNNYMGQRDETYFCELLKKNSPFTFRYRVFIDKTLSN
ncbi:type VI secretion system baseplate subunit TssF [Dysgonomonas sp. HGC4]|uniref:type VI secretion system baseplate subunit TssF n=1 Tax=Dysgonomonas sp. HGC4 TaxID=1658009 RepID=UPI000682CA7F|nr:type VI secretion system baseplate subunit TssF [Dysgonomonas sp. HGC4]MBD8347640.1 type VI secretion system baseplate subunit TssF [Dysgonomonas sp. HGC4]